MKAWGITESAARAGMLGRLGGDARLLHQLAVIRTLGESHGIGPVLGLLERGLARGD